MTLQLDDVEVRYGDHVAVHPVSMTLPAGALVAVTGPSGAGKTSLLWATCRAVTRGNGEVTVDGRAIGTHDDALDAGVVLIPQGNGLARVLTATENILLPLMARRGRPAEEATARETAAGALAAVGMAESHAHLVEELSGGQQQRVAVARGLAQRASVLLADEPTSELDATNRDVVLALLRAEADRGAVVVLATNDLDAVRVCDAHATLHEGRLTWERGLERAGPRHRA
ncbi:ATP-binding cassette domain-containing protein [Nocardioides sp. C4-1]|uniref:ATP-binding cassette domain-containing protein n=1 Tax=Nocardioides sp. C4-1 TaxID=3151851 RepID=UPI003263BE42